MDTLMLIIVILFILTVGGISVYFTQPDIVGTLKEMQNDIHAYFHPDTRKGLARMYFLITSIAFTFIVFLCGLWFTDEILLYMIIVWLPIWAICKLFIETMIIPSISENEDE